MPPSEDSAASSDIEPPFEEDAESEDEKPTPDATDAVEAPIPMQEKKEGTPKDGEGITTSIKAEKEDLSKYKTQVASRLAKALEEMSPSSAHRSPDLVPLTKDFQNMRKKLRSLIVSAKAYQKATLKVEKSRSKVSHSFQGFEIFYSQYD
jgi:hypothetical protein